MLLWLMMTLVGSDPCDQVLTDMHNIRSQLKEMKYCECMTYDALRDAYASSNTVFKQAKRCPGLEAQADSLKQVFNTLLDKADK